MAKIHQVRMTDLGFGGLPTFDSTMDARIHKIIQEFGYELQQPNWIRHKHRKNENNARTLVAIVEIGKSNLGDLDLSFVDDYFRWYAGWKKKYSYDEPEYHAESKDIDSAFDAIIEKDDSCRIVKAFSSVTLYTPTATSFRGLFKTKVIPLFFNRYPEGRIVVFRQNFGLESMVTVAKLLYSCKQLPVAEHIQNQTSDFPTLRHWHSNQPQGLHYCFLQLSNFLWYPNVTGFIAGRFGMPIMFMFDKPEQYATKPFPEDWLAVLRSHCEMGGQKVNERFVMKDIRDPNHLQIAHRRTLHSTCPNIGDRYKFMSWFIERTNSFLFDLYDITSYEMDSDPETIDPIGAFEAMITFERL